MPTDRSIDLQKSVCWFMSAIFTSFISGAGFYAVALLLEFVKNYHKEHEENKRLFREFLETKAFSQDTNRPTSNVSRFHSPDISKRSECSAVSKCSTYKRSSGLLSCPTNPQNSEEIPPSRHNNKAYVWSPDFQSLEGTSAETVGDLEKQDCHSCQNDIKSNSDRVNRSLYRSTVSNECEYITSHGDELIPSKSKPSVNRQRQIIAHKSGNGNENPVRCIGKVINVKDKGNVVKHQSRSNPLRYAHSCDAMIKHETGFHVDLEMWKDLVKEEPPIVVNFLEPAFIQEINKGITCRRQEQGITCRRQEQGITCRRQEQGIVLTSVRKSSLERTGPKYYNNRRQFNDPSKTAREIRKIHNVLPESKTYPKMKNYDQLVFSRKAKRNNKTKGKSPTIPSSNGKGTESLPKPRKRTSPSPYRQKPRSDDLDSRVVGHADHKHTPIRHSSPQSRKRSPFANKKRCHKHNTSYTMLHTNRKQVKSPIMKQNSRLEFSLRSREVSKYQMKKPITRGKSSRSECPRHPSPKARRNAAGKGRQKGIGKPHVTTAFTFVKQNRNTDDTQPETVYVNGRRSIGVSPHEERVKESENMKEKTRINHGDRRSKSKQRKLEETALASSSSPKHKHDSSNLQCITFDKVSSTYNERWIGLGAQSSSSSNSLEDSSSVITQIAYKGLDNLKYSEPAKKRTGKSVTKLKAAILNRQTGLYPPADSTIKTTKVNAKLKKCSSQSKETHPQSGSVLLKSKGRYKIKKSNSPCKRQIASPNYQDGENGSVVNVKDLTNVSKGVNRTDPSPTGMRTHVKGPHGLRRQTAATGEEKDEREHEKVEDERVVEEEGVQQLHDMLSKGLRSSSLSSVESRATACRVGFPPRQFVSHDVLTTSHVSSWAINVVRSIAISVSLIAADKDDVSRGPADTSSITTTLGDES